MERWKQIPFDTGIETYMVSDYGQIKKLSRKSIAKYCPDTKERLMSPKLTGKGYHRTSLLMNGKDKWYYIHRLVGLLFVENPDNKPCINHKDGNKINNHFSNLEWCTIVENNEHGFTTGLLKHYSKNPPLACHYE